MSIQVPEAKTDVKAVQSAAEGEAAPAKKRKRVTMAEPEKKGEEQKGGQQGNASYRN